MSVHEVRRSCRLETKTHNRQHFINNDLPCVKKAPKTAAEKMRDYRKRIKENPDEYKIWRETEKQRRKTYREQRPQDVIERQRVLNTANKKKQRQTAKEQGLKHAKKLKTRSTSEKERDQARERKRKQRAKMTDEQRKIHNEMRRKCYKVAASARGTILHTYEETHIPEAELENPARESEPENQTQEPENQTQEPENQTQEPENQTQEPENQTQEPENQTQEPENHNPIDTLNTNETQTRELQIENQNVIHTPNRHETGTTPSSGYSTKAAKRMAAMRVKASLPGDSEKCAEVLAHLIHNATPRKKKILEQQCIVSPSTKKELVFMNSAVSSVLLETKSKRKNADLKMRRNLARTIIAAKRVAGGKLTKSQAKKQFGFSWVFLSKASTMIDDTGKTTRGLKPAVVQRVEQFYKRQDVSRIDPGYRAVSKKTNLTKSYLELSITKAYEQFMTENDDISLSMSKFAALRPRNIKTMSKRKLNQCLCEYCTNVEMKIDALNRFLCRRHLNRLRVEDKYALSRMTLCQKENEHYGKPCIDRKCDKCGTENIKTHLNQATEEWSTHTLSWMYWGTLPTKGRKALLQKTKTLSSFVDELMEEMVPFSKHLVNASWQSTQFNKLKEHLPPGWNLQVLDFAENFSCEFQDEIQSLHWCHDMVTIHPVVSYMYCPICSCINKEAFVFVSDDLQHDSHAVNYFTTKVVSILKERDIKLDKIVQFTDGAASQYKCKSAFIDASLSKAELGVQIEKNFYGSRHGKAPCDSEIGTVKRLVRDAIKSNRAVITNAQDFFKYCVDELTKEDLCPNHNSRQFIYVPNGTIDHERTQRFENTSYLKGTQQLHSIRGDAPYRVSYRERSCCCTACQNENGNCLNADFVGTWKSCTLRRNYEGITDESNLLTSEGTNNEEMCPTPSPCTSTDVTQHATSTTHMSGNEMFNEGTTPGNVPDVNYQLPSTSSPTNNDAIQKPCGDVFKVGDWVLASYSTKNNVKLFLGLILQIDSGEARVKFCRKHGKYFTWPVVEDISWIDTYCLTVIDTPIMDSREKMSLSDKEMAFFN